MEIRLPRNFLKVSDGPLPFSITKGAKTMKRFLILLILFLVGIGGCTPTNIGPFVTDIAYDGEGNLTVTKNMLVLDSFAKTLSIGGNPQTIVIKAASKDPPKSK